MWADAKQCILDKYELTQIANMIETVNRDWTQSQSAKYK